MGGDVSPGPFHQGTADRARFLIHFPKMLSARKSSLDHNTECITVNKINI